LKFNKYLTENYLSTEELKRTILIECSDIIKIYKKAKSFLYRGTKIYPFDYIKKSSRLEDRIPRDTPIEIHNYMNNYFMKNFGWKGRNGVFASNNDITLYGSDVGVFFPYNGFKFIYSSKIDDLTMYLELVNKKYDKFDNNKKQEIYKKLNEILITYTDKNLYKVLNHYNKIEVSFKCDYYYVIDYKYFEDEFGDIF